MSDSTALEFTIEKQISRTFRSVDLSQLVYKPLKYFEKIVYQLRKIYGSNVLGICLSLVNSSAALSLINSNLRLKSYG